MHPRPVDTDKLVVALCKYYTTQTQEQCTSAVVKKDGYAQCRNCSAYR